MIQRADPALGTVPAGPRKRGTRVLIVGRYALFRAGIANALGKEADFEIAGEADHSNAVERAIETLPDVLLVDLPLASGIEMTQHLKREVPAAAIVVMAASDDEDALFAATTAGATALIRRDIEEEALRWVIRRVASGEDLIADQILATPAVAARLINELRRWAISGRKAGSRFAPLSLREVEVLEHVARGMTNRQVATALSLSEQTVKNHMANITRKLSVRRRAQAVAYAMQQGWIATHND